jgi:hypothetical protein
LVAYTVLYWVKVGATSFLLRVLLRRLLARAAFRFFIPIVAIGVFAVWNGLITWWVLREARARCLGPVAVQDWREQLGSMREDLGSSARTRILEDAVLGMLLLTAVLDGRISRSEVQFVEEAHHACDRSFQREILSELHQELLQGRGCFVNSAN